MATAAFSFWVFPCHLTIFLVFLLLLIFLVVRAGIKHYNHWVILKAEEMLEQEQEHVHKTDGSSHSQKKI